MAFNFLSLPLEVRLIIYGYLVKRKDQIIPFTYGNNYTLSGYKPFWLSKGLLLSYKQIKDEVSGILYGDNVFNLLIGRSHFKQSLSSISFQSLDPAIEICLR